MQLSASKFWLAQVCAYPFHSGLEAPQGKPSWVARLGTLTHKYLEDWYEGGIDPSVNPVGGRYGATARQVEIARGLAVSGARYVHVAGRGGDGVHSHKAELAYAVCGRTGVGGHGVPLQPHAHRDYSGCPDGWVPGTADLCTFDKTLHLVVLRDWKTGLFAEPYKSQALAQVRLLGLAAAKVHGYGDEIRVEAVYLRKDSPEPFVHGQTMRKLDLLMVAAELAEVQNNITNKQPPQPGEHCSRCPVRASCPEYSNG